MWGTFNIATALTLGAPGRSRTHFPYNTIRILGTVSLLMGQILWAPGPPLTSGLLWGSVSSLTWVSSGEAADCLEAE